MKRIKRATKARITLSIKKVSQESLKTARMKTP